jgi:ABC-2 type transport system ATP-binding protein
MDRLKSSLESRILIGMQDTDRHATASVPARAAVPALGIEGLRKAYGDTVALAGVDLRVAPGTVLGLLGPNGAGKTSLVSIVAGLRRPDAGAVEVCGVDAVRRPHEVRRLIGFAPQETGLYLTLSVRDNLRFFAGLAGLRRAEGATRIDEVSHALGLESLLGRRTGHLSGGERRRVHTAIALLHRPALVLLDEPTTGADVRTRTQILDLVRDLAREGSAVVYSTHYLQEIETLDADVAFLDRGRVVARGRTAELVEQHGSSALELTFAAEVPAAARVIGAVIDGATVRIPAPDPAARAAQLLPSLGTAASSLRSIEILRPSLESVYLAVTGRRYIAQTEEPAA